MLGPELLNLTVRPTPIFLKVPPVCVSISGPRELGLANFQVVKGVVSSERGQLYINLAGVAQPLLAPDIFKRYAGQNLYFRVQLTPDGATVLRPIQAPVPSTTTSTPPAATATTQLGTAGFTVDDTRIFQELCRLLWRPRSQAWYLPSPAMSIEADRQSEGVIGTWRYFTATAHCGRCRP